MSFQKSIPKSISKSFLEDSFDAFLDKLLKYTVDSNNNKKKNITQNIFDKLFKNNTTEVKSAISDTGEKLKTSIMRINPLKNKINPIDQYTSVDEILINNQLALNNLIKQQMITNKLLIAMIQGMGNGAGLPIKEGALTGIISGMVNENSYKTLRYEFENQPIIGSSTVMTDTGAGNIAEAMFLTPYVADGDDNQIFTVRIVSDGNPIYNNSFLNYLVSSNFEVDMTAFDNGEYNCITFQNIAFNESIHVEVNSSKATFTRIYVKLHKKIL